MITIRNKKTGEVKQIQDTDLNTYGLAPQTAQTGMLGMGSPAPTIAPTESTTPKITTDQLYKMSLDPKIKPAVYNKFKAVYDLQKEELKSATPDKDAIDRADKEKQADALRTKGLDAVNELLKMDTGAIARVPNLFKAITGENAQTKNTFNQLKAVLSLDNVKYLKGQGAVSDAERALLAASATPLDTNLTNEDFYNALLKIKSDLSGEAVNPAEKKEKVNPLKSLTLPNARNIAGDAGVGAGLNLEPATQESFNSLLESAKRTEEKAAQVTDPKQKAALLKVASDARALISKETKKISGSFSEDIKKDTTSRALGGATEIASTAAGAGSIKSLLTKPPKLTGPKSFLNSTIFPGSKASLDAAKSQVTKKFSGDVLAKEVEKYVTKDPLAKSVADKILPSLKGKSFTAEELLDRIPVWNKAFSAAGKVGKSSKAGLYTTLSRVAREQMKKETPELFKAYTKWAKGLSIKSFGSSIAGQVPRAVLTGTAIAAGTNLLNKFTRRED